MVHIGNKKQRQGNSTLPVLKLPIHLVHQDHLGLRIKHVLSPELHYSFAKRKGGGGEEWKIEGKDRREGEGGKERRKGGRERKRRKGRKKRSEIVKENFLKL